MIIKLNKGQVHTVEIESGMFDSPMALDISPMTAYHLLLALEAKREEIEDLAMNYYTCPECGLTHHNGVKRCPTFHP